MRCDTLPAALPTPPSLLPAFPSQEDGGDIRFRSFDPDSGVVELKMMGACRWGWAGQIGQVEGGNGRLQAGAGGRAAMGGGRSQARLPSAAHQTSAHRLYLLCCSGCPSSAITLKSGIENMLMHYIPEVGRAALQPTDRRWLHPPLQPPEATSQTDPCTPSSLQVKSVVEAPADEHEEEGLKAFNELEKHLSA